MRLGRLEISLRPAAIIFNHFDQTISTISYMKSLLILGSIYSHVHTKDDDLAALLYGHLVYRCRSRYAGAGEEPYILVQGVWGERHWVMMPVVKQAEYTDDQLKPKSP